MLFSMLFQGRNEDEHSRRDERKGSGMNTNAYRASAETRISGDNTESSRVRAYLEQGLFLDRRIRFDLLRLEQMRADMYVLSSPRPDSNKVQSSPTGEALFAKALERLEQMGERISREISLLTDLKAQIESVIRQLDHPGYQLVLTGRYLENLSLPAVADRLRISLSTAKAWHRDALGKLTLPENPIRI